MLKNICLAGLLFCLLLNANAATAIVKADSLVKILQLSNRNLRDQELVIYIKSVFDSQPLRDFYAAKRETDDLLSKYAVTGRPAFDHFIESTYQFRASDYNKAQSDLVKAIAASNKAGDHYLVYAFFNQLAFVQTYIGNTIDAVSSFRMAKKEAVALNDPRLQVVIDINISDIYYRNDFYNQSLFYLDQADSIMNISGLNAPRLNNAINYNKCENYFRMDNVNLLKKYNRVLNNVKRGNAELYIYKKRTDYYVSLLQHNYKSAVQQILSLKKDTLYGYDRNIDEQNLADAYYNDGQLDSAKSIIERLLGDPAQNNHPEIKFHLYEVLGEVAEQKNDYKQAAYNFKMALQQSENDIGRLTQVGNISSEIKIDEMEGFFAKLVGGYQREQVWLIFTVIGTILVIAIGGMLYRNVKQKRYYEQLLFDAKKEELAFINSHEVRRHLSNILGIIDMINQSENRDEAYLQAEDHLLSAAESLDAAIKNISEKLDN